MIQVNRIYLIFNRLVTKKFLVDTSDNLKEKTRYVKVAFDALENVYMDEIFVNPSIR